MYDKQSGREIASVWTPWGDEMAGGSERRVMTLRLGRRCRPFLSATTKEKEIGR
jgi:hypothetical protein